MTFLNSRCDHGGDNCPHPLFPITAPLCVALQDDSRPLYHFNAGRNLLQDALSNSNGCLSKIPKCEPGACATRNIQGVAHWVCLRCLSNYDPVVDSSGQDNIIQCGEWSGFRECSVMGSAAIRTSHVPCCLLSLKLPEHKEGGGGHQSSSGSSSNTSAGISCSAPKRCCSLPLLVAGGCV